MWFQSQNIHEFGRGCAKWILLGSSTVQLFFRSTTIQTYQFLMETVAALNEHLEPEKKLSDLEKNFKFFWGFFKIKIVPYTLCWVQGRIYGGRAEAVPPLGFDPLPTQRVSPLYYFEETGHKRLFWPVFFFKISPAAQKVWLKQGLFSALGEKFWKLNIWLT